MRNILLSEPAPCPEPGGPVAYLSVPEPTATGGSSKLGGIMSRLSPVWRIATKWYVSGLILGSLGIILGSMVFFFAWPGKPKVAIIDIPFTVINDRAASEISALLDFARRDDSIKAVVIQLSSPGGSAAASEHLFFETARLRQEKPVVMVMGGLVASGGYMMALGSNYMYAQPSSFVGSIGVILSPIPPLLPRQPSERVVLTGPSKAEGGNRRHFVSLIEELRQGFVQIVLTQRGDRLRMPVEEVAQGNIYSGVTAVRLGLVDAIGGSTDAVKKAASLANILHYDLVDVNTEVSRILNEKRHRISEPLLRGSELPLWSDQRLRADGLAAQREPLGELAGLGLLDSGWELDALRTLPTPGGIGEDPRSALPDFPLKINGPNVYYLYVGPSP